MTADFATFRFEAEEVLRTTLPDPRDAEWIAELMESIARRFLAGQKIPSRHAADLLDKQARAAELIHLGATVVAERQVCSRSQAYRRAQKHRTRKVA